MRILILTNIDTGLYYFRKELIEKLLIKNEVIVAFPFGNLVEKFNDMGCKCIETSFNRRGKNPFMDLALLKRYKAIIRDVNPDLVLTYTIKPNVYGGIACQQLKVPYLSNITGIGTSISNGGILSSIALLLYKQGLKKSYCVFFQNESNMKLFEANHILKGKVRLIPGSGVNLQQHSFEEYPSDNSVTKLLFVGRVMKDKGIEELLGAVNTLNGIHLDIVGEYDEDYSRMIQDFQKKGIVTYHGHQENVHSFMKGAHCVVLPSYHEGMSNVLLEAASTGRPIVATNVSGCKETYDEGITGFGCSPKSVESLQNAIKRFLCLSWEEKKRMGEMGRRKMEREFDRDIVVNAYLEEISKLER